MNKLSTRFLPLVLAALGSAALCGSCESTGSTKGYDVTVKATDSMTALRDDGIQLKARSASTVKSLGSLLDNPAIDPKPQFEHFSKELKEFDSAAKSFNSRFETMKARANERFTVWQTENATINDKDIRDQADKRRANALEEMGKVEKQAAAVKSQVDPLVVNLQDVQKYLSSDLSPAGISSAKGMVKKAGGLEKDLQESVDDLNKELDDLIQRFSPSKAPAKA